MRPARAVRVAILRTLGALLVVLAAGACVYPATQVVVLVSTDIPEDVPVTLTARVSRGTGGSDAAEPALQRWTRRLPGAGSSDAGITFPASFTVVPVRGAPDEVVTVVLEADAGGVVLRRTARFAFVRHTTLTLPVFLTARCVERATGCAAPGPCTVAQRCEERGMTCGNDGSCVAVPVPLTPDAGLPDAGPYGGCGLYGQACCPVGDACHGALTCVGERCQRCTDPGEVCCTGGDLMPNGTVCVATPADARCQTGGTCSDGVCSAVANVADGTPCDPTSDPCMQPGTCLGGACQPATPRADGTPCGAAPDACHDAPRCAGGRCGAAPARADGTPCGAAPNACHDVPRCTGGRCGAAAAHPDGTQWGNAVQRCCGGNPVSVNTTANCGACGLACAAGRACTQLRGQPQWYCGCAANSECWSGCCVTYYGAPYACGASHCSSACIACPGGATCHPDTSNPYYCSY